jgi:TatD DNase family protein
MATEHPALVDIGVNLSHRQLRPDLPAVLARAREAGVTQLLATGTSVAGSREVAQLAADHPDVFATAGVHPHAAKECDASTMGTIGALLEAPRVVAVGECGLDYDRDFSPRPVQRQWFAAQLALACERGLPVFLHERSAHVDFAAILAEHRPQLTGGVVHCFTGTGDELDTYLALDMHIGITGWICDERRGLHLREIVDRIPPDRLLIETDAPFLLPRTLRPKPKSRRNEPSYLVHVLQTVAEAVGRPVAQVAAESTAAARRLFSLPS